MKIIIELLVVICILFFFTAVLFFLLWKREKKQKEVEKRTIERMEEVIRETENNYQRLKKVMEVTNKNRSEADGKIQNLHNGDTVNNALTELSKHDRCKKGNVHS